MYTVITALYQLSALRRGTYSQSRVFQNIYNEVFLEDGRLTRGNWMARVYLGRATGFVLAGACLNATTYHYLSIAST